MLKKFLLFLLITITNKEGIVDDVVIFRAEEGRERVFFAERIKFGERAFGDVVDLLATSALQLGDALDVLQRNSARAEMLLSAPREQALDVADRLGEVDAQTALVELELGVDEVVLAVEAENLVDGGARRSARREDLKERVALLTIGLI